MKWKRFEINVYNNVYLIKYCDAEKASKIVQEFNKKSVYCAKWEEIDGFSGDESKEYMIANGKVYEFTNDANKYNSLLHTCCWIIDNQVELNDKLLNKVDCLKCVENVTGYARVYENAKVSGDEWVYGDEELS